MLTSLYIPQDDAHVLSIIQIPSFSGLAPASSL